MNMQGIKVPPPPFPKLICGHKNPPAASYPVGARVPGVSKLPRIATYFELCSCQSKHVFAHTNTHTHINERKIFIS